MDWESGQSRQYDAIPSPSTLLLAGDWAPVRQFAGMLSSRPGELYGDDLLEAFSAADYRIINVESVLHDNPQALKPVPKEGPNLVGPAGAVNDLKALGTELALLANNHTYDFGNEGLQATRDVLKAEGIQTCGSGSNQDDAYDGTVLPLQGRPIAVINFQEGEEGTYTERAPELAGWDLGRVTASIRAHRKAGRTVIAIPHADREFLPFPAPYIQQAYRSLVEAGAAAVIAHHPHVPRGVEVYRGAPIFYSLGNFTFWQEHPGRFRKIGYLVSLRIGDNSSIAWKLIPYRITPERIERLKGEQLNEVLSHLKTVSGEYLSPESVQDAWHAAIDAIPISAWYASCTGMDYTFKCLQERNPTGLARMRTRLSSPAHYHFMAAGITRILGGKHGQSDPGLVQKVRLWTEGT